MTALLAIAAGVLYSGGPAGPGAGGCDRGSDATGPGVASTRPAGPAPQAGGPLPLPAGLVGVPVRLADPATLTVLHPGNRVDLLTLPVDQPPRAPQPPAQPSAAAEDPQSPPRDPVAAAGPRHPTRDPAAVEILAGNVLVLAVGATGPGQGSLTEPAVLVLALTTEQATRTVGAPVDARFGVIVRA